jgi:hypothetical protein
MITAIYAHHVFTFHGSGGGNFFEGVFTISHSVDFTVGEKTESVGTYDVFALVTIFFLFGSVFGRLFSLCLGIEI